MPPAVNVVTGRNVRPASSKASVAGSDPSAYEIVIRELAVSC